MKQAQIIENVRSLTERRAAIAALAGMERTNALLKSGKQATGDVGDTDLGSDIAEQDVALGLAQIEGIELAKIDAALERAKNGRYGVCELCGCQIDEKRLAAIPEASCCIGCLSPEQMN